MDALTFTPTPEQSAITSAVRNSDANIIVEALAGTGKTTTLDLIQAASPKLPVLCLAFNKSVAQEATKRFPSTTTVRTFNSLGHRVWAKTVSSLSFDTKKMQNILKEEINGYKGDDRKALSEGYWDIVAGVSMAKALGYIPAGVFPSAKRLIERDPFHANLETKPSGLVAQVIDHALISSIQASYRGVIDFNDQIYMPALFGGTFPRFPFVLVDEFQDLSPTNHEMLNKLVRGRIAAVGDQFQCIYAFRGVESSGGAKLREKFKMQALGLTHSFRCPRQVVEAVRWRVPGFKWIKEGGHVEILSSLRADRVDDGAVIICRNNAPLFKLAFGLLQHKRSVQVAGSEIGPRITRLLRKLGEDDLTQTQLLGKIAEWKAQKLSTSNLPSTICDMAACMTVFASFGSTLGQAIGYAEHLFKQSGTIKLTTGHKAKGLEWDTVYHLDPWLCSDSEQDQNLRYVITTRSANILYEIDSRDIRW